MSQTETQQSTEQPRRKSLFKNNKFLNKFKSNSKDQVTTTEPTTLSSVELPQIEQLQPIDTTISGENNAETSKDQQLASNEGVEDNKKEENIEEKEDEKDQVALVEDGNDTQDVKKNDEIKEQIKNEQGDSENNETNETNDNTQENEQEEEVIVAEVEVKNNQEPSEEKDEIKKENEKPAKRTSLIQKWFKKSSKPTIDTSKKEEEKEVEKKEYQQQEEEEVEEKEQVKAKKDEEKIVNKPSSPLGRKFNEFLSRLPNKKDKKQSVTSEKVQISESSEIVAAA